VAKMDKPLFIFNNWSVFGVVPIFEVNNCIRPTLILMSLTANNAEHFAA